MLEGPRRLVRSSAEGPAAGVFRTGGVDGDTQKLFLYVAAAATGRVALAQNK